MQVYARHVATPQPPKAIESMEESLALDLKRVASEHALEVKQSSPWGEATHPLFKPAPHRFRESEGGLHRTGSMSYGINTPHVVSWHEGRRSPTSDTSGSGPGSPLLPPREDNEEEEAAAGQPLNLIRALSRSAAAGTQEDMEEENSIENRSGSLNAFLRTPSERRRWSGNARK